MYLDSLAPKLRNILFAKYKNMDLVNEKLSLAT